MIFHNKFLECMGGGGGRAIQAGYLMEQGGEGGRALKAGYMMEHLNPGEIEHIIKLLSTLLCQRSCMICENV